MTLIKSISGIRGTIGGKPGDALTPLDIIKFSSAYATWIKERSGKKTGIKIVVGRDARISGAMVNSLVCHTLVGCGIDVVDLGLSTTPTVEVAVPYYKADGGIILTASHNPKQWNALKLLNEKGEFISGEDGKKLLDFVESENFDYTDVDHLGKIETKSNGFIDEHIEMVLKLHTVDVEAIKKANFKVVVDAVNSTGGIAIPALLEKLGVQCTKLYCDPTGHFPHNPEPLPEHLRDISELVVKSKADLGIVVDPDVDRLALVCEDGEMFGEEYTLVAVADYVLSINKGDTVSNLSSTRALKDVTEKHGQKHHQSAVGELNVVEMMKANNAVIGGEGNGGIIYPELHYGRDALVGVALFLSYLAKSGKKASQLRASYPNYFISKNKIELTPEIDVNKVLDAIEKKYAKEQINKVDGIKIEFAEEWVHLRKSNTEPIIRIYSESKSEVTANNLANKLIMDIKEIIREI